MDWLRSLFITHPRPTWTFYPTLLLFHVFPFHSPVTLFIIDAPFGRFASQTSRWNLNGTDTSRNAADVLGNLAWFSMEIVAVSL